MKDKLESLTGGSGVHVFLVLWKAGRAVETYGYPFPLAVPDQVCIPTTKHSTSLEGS